MLRGLMAPSPRSSFAGSARSSLGSQNELVPLTRAEACQDPLLGRNIRKSFGGQFFFGNVVSIDVDADSGERHYHVAYEDGDEEHMRAAEVEPLLQAGRMSMGGLSTGRLSGASLASRQAAPSCRPSFSASRAATPRQSGASQAARPSMPMGGRMDFGGDPNTTAIEDGCPVHWWAAGIAMVLLYCVVSCLPSCFSCSVGIAAPVLDTFGHFSNANSDFSEYSMPASTLPSNAVLLSSLPATRHTVFDETPAATQAPSRASVDEEALPAQREPSSGKPTDRHFWRYTPEEPATTSEDAAMPTEQAAMPTEEAADAVEAADTEEADATSTAFMPDMAGALSNAGAWLESGSTSISATSEYILGSFQDLVEIAFSVLAFLVTSGTVLFIGNFFQGQGQQVGVDAAHPLIDMSQGGVAGLGDRTASPLRMDPSSPLLLPGGAPCRLGPESAAISGAQEVQIGAYYVANLGIEHKVVKTMQLNATKDAVMVKEFACSASRTGPVTFKGTQQCFELPLTSLLQGPFSITAGRAPKHVSEIFESSRPLPAACPTPSRAAEAGNRCFDLTSQRFKYPSSLRKMQDLGFEDSQLLRDVLTSYRGNVDQALQEFWTD